MPLDPYQPQPLDPMGRVFDLLRTLERRLDAIERGDPIVQVSAGAPDGSFVAKFVVDETNHRLYVRDGTSYRYAGLT